MTNATSNNEEMNSNQTIDLELSLIGFGLVFMSLSIIIPNAIVIYVFKITKKLQKPKYYFILSLAVADLLVGLISINPYTVLLMIGHWPLGRGLCYTWLVLDHYIGTASNFCLIFIAFDRFGSIFHPMTHKVKCDARFMKRCVILIWTLPVLVWPLPILIYPFTEEDPDRFMPSSECNIHFYQNDITITSIVVVLSYIAPSIILLVIYFCISRRISRISGVEKKIYVIPNKAVENIASFSNTLDDVESTPDLCDNKKGHINQRFNIKDATSTIEDSLDSANSTSQRDSRVNSLDTMGVKKVGKHFEDGKRMRFPTVTETLMLSPRPRSATMTTELENHNELQSTTAQTAPKQQRRFTLNTLDFHMKLGFNSTVGTKRHRTSNISFYGKRKTSCERKMDKCRQKTKRSALKWILLVSTAFIICWFPYHITVLARSILKISLPEHLWRFCYIFGWLNSLFNPVCYAFANREFKNRVKEVFWKKR
ncbi:muscarinic acetylcholine receptor M2-like [Clytia hemisphaerica]|uniref:G-protein coupled receptors family 1 profile domain-containing protein n=1 Tax=Clytia hemisphaerica TaxID=252671 RepID=A0A7M5UVV7_9CNID